MIELTLAILFAAPPQAPEAFKTGYQSSTGSMTREAGDARCRAKSFVFAVERRPTVQIAVGDYPVKAVFKSMEGTTVVDCTVQEGGQLGGCTVTAEAPVEFGFAKGALMDADKLSTSILESAGRTSEAPKDVIAAGDHVCLITSWRRMDLRTAPVIVAPRSPDTTSSPK